MLIAAVLVAAAGVITAIGLEQVEREGREDRWLDRAETSLRHEVDMATASLLGLTTLADSDGEVNATRFARYADTQLHRFELYAMAWVAIVPGPERTAFERRTGVEIVEASGTSLTDLTFRRAPVRDRYLVYLHLAQRESAARYPRGLNVGEDTPALVAALRARDTGRPTMSTAIPVGGGSRMLQLAVPAYAPDRPTATPPQRRAAFRALAVAGFELGELEAFVARSLPQRAGLRLIPAGMDAPVDGPHRAVEVAGLRWTVVVHVPARWSEWVGPAAIMLAGLALTVLMALMFRAANRRHEALAAASAKQAALRRVATAAAAEPGTIFATVAREAAGLMGAEGAVVGRFDRDLIVPMGTHGLSLPAPPMRRDGNGVFARIARDGRPARIDDYSALPREDLETLGAWGHALGSAVGVPVMVDGRLWGGLLVAHTHHAPFPPGAEEDLALFADITATAISSAEARALLDRQATTDPLTGLANRRAFDRRMEKELARVRRGGPPLAVVVLDVDHFKAINDTHGHAVGDAVLAEVGRRLAALTRTQDLVARVGGEEFAWLITGADSADAAEAAERARRAITALPIDQVGTVTASFGVCDSLHAGDARSLLDGADRALYRAKQAGRNRVERFDAEALPVAAAPAQPGSAPAQD